MSKRVEWLKSRLGWQRAALRTRFVFESHSQDLLHAKQLTVVAAVPRGNGDPLAALIGANPTRVVIHQENFFRCRAGHERQVLVLTTPRHILQLFREIRRPKVSPDEFADDLARVGFFNGREQYDARKALVAKRQELRETGPRVGAVRVVYQCAFEVEREYANCHRHFFSRFNSNSISRDFFSVLNSVGRSFSLSASA